MNARREIRIAGSLTLAASVLTWVGVEAIGQVAPPPPPAPALEGPAPVAADAPAVAQDVPEGVEILTRGPVHEAFAEPVVFDPEAGLVVGQEPPAAVEELPPDQKPEGDDVVWIAGYWAWDDTRDDFLWVSGIWRKLPPGRQWIPGYWAKVDEGFQWVSGYWAPLEQDEVEYLPTPPQTLEVGPNTPAPGDEYVWNPGYWSWYEQRYAWSPGSWVQTQPNWIWIPPTYRYTPIGCVFVPGYWDYIVADRGMLFAPAYFGPAYFAQPAVVYRPSIVINVAILTDFFFCRPSYNHYFFGDYYGFSGAGQPYMPWFAFHQTRRGFDPIYAWSAARYDRGWTTVVREQYYERVVQTSYRPPHTFQQYQQWSARRLPSGVAAPALARTLAQVQTARDIQGVRLERVDANRQAELTRRTQLLDQFRAQRVEREAHTRDRAANAIATRTQAQGLAEARRVQMPRSPMAAARLSSGERFGTVQEAATEALRRRQEVQGQVVQRGQEAATEARAGQARSVEAARERMESQRSGLAESAQRRQETLRAGQAEQLQRRQQLQSGQAEALRQRQDQRATIDQSARQAAANRRQEAEDALQNRLQQRQGAQAARQEQLRQFQQGTNRPQAQPRVVVPGAGSQPQPNAVSPIPNRALPGQVIERRQQALQQQAQQAQAARDAAQQQAAQRQQQQAAIQQQQAASRQQQLDALRRQQQQSGGQQFQQQQMNNAQRQQQAQAARQQQLEALRRQQQQAPMRQPQVNPRQFQQPGGGPQAGPAGRALQRPFQAPQRPAASGGQAQQKRQEAVEAIQRRRAQQGGPRP